MATSYEIFEKAERAEQLAAALYQVLAQRFSGDREARDLFLRLEQEELQHASRVRLLGTRYRHDPRVLGRLAVDHSALDSILEEGERALRDAQDGSFARTVDEARTRLRALEEHCARAHAEMIAREGNPALRHFFRKLAEQDRAHGELLGGK